MRDFEIFFFTITNSLIAPAEDFDKVANSKFSFKQKHYALYRSSQYYLCKIVYKIS